MTQNWTSIVESNWIFFKFYLLIYIYIYIYINFVPNKFFLVLQKKKKKAHKYKIFKKLYFLWFTCIRFLFFILN